MATKKESQRLHLTMVSTIDDDAGDICRNSECRRNWTRQGGPEQRCDAESEADAEWESGHESPSNKQRHAAWETRTRWCGTGQLDAALNVTGTQASGRTLQMDTLSEKTMVMKYASTKIIPDA